MYSVLLSGYMFANAWTRLSLTQSMAELPVGLLPAPPPASSIGSGSSSNGAGGGVSGSSSTGGGYAGALDGAISIGSGAAAAAAAAYAPGSQKLAVEGQVLRWHLENGKEAVPALQYIEQLEAELAELRQQMEASAAATASAAAAASSLQPLPGNELLEYLQRLSPDDLVSLTDAASEDVLEAMNLFVQRLMGEWLAGLRVERCPSMHRAASRCLLASLHVLPLTSLLLSLPPARPQAWRRRRGRAARATAPPASWQRSCTGSWLLATLSASWSSGATSPAPSTCRRPAPSRPRCRPAACGSAWRGAWRSAAPPAGAWSLAEF